MHAFLSFLRQMRLKWIKVPTKHRDDPENNNKIVVVQLGKLS